MQEVCQATPPQRLKAPPPHGVNGRIRFRVTARAGEDCDNVTQAFEKIAKKNLEASIEDVRRNGMTNHLRLY